VRFPYLRFSVAPTPAHTGSALAYRPYIPILVVGTRGAARLDALLDTGADQVILPRSIAEPLGIDLDVGASARFRGVGGQIVTVIYGRVELEVGTRSQRIRWPATVAFLDGAGGAILGHTGFLEYFTATFNGQQRHVALTPNSALPGRSVT
jgi:hypothetical protein